MITSAVQFLDGPRKDIPNKKAENTIRISDWAWSKTQQNCMATRLLHQNKLAPYDSLRRQETEKRKKYLLDYC
jgi:hypothetical protein